MDALQAKILTMVCLGTSSLAAGLLPSWCIPAGSTNVSQSLFLSSLLCIGSGILFATSMVHMLPEVHEDLPNKAEIITCVGFLLLYLIEEIIHCIKGKKTLPKKCDYCLNGRNGNSSSYGAVSRENYQQYPYNPAVAESEFLMTRCTCAAVGAVCHVSDSTTQSASHVGLLLALGIHSVLEGLAIGVQTSPGKVVVLAGAVASHKLVVAFGLGIELTAVRENSKCSVLCAMTTFALCSVVGIGVGMIFTNGEVIVGVSDFLPILQGLAVGTLLYVTLSEVLPRERLRFHHTGSRFSGIVQFFSMLFGFGIMAILTIYLDPDEEIENGST